MLCNNMASISFSFEENYSEDVLRSLSKEFSRVKGLAYLDHTAATLYAESQINGAHEDLLGNVYGNPHSLSLSSKHACDAIETIRYRILNYFHNLEEYSVIFTSGATAALKLVVETFDWSGSETIKKPQEKRVISSPGEDIYLKPKLQESLQEKDAGNFIYFNESHTSVLGMREVAKAKGSFVRTISKSELRECFSKTFFEQATPDACNSLFVYPAQCNFSGVKYPLKWTERVQNGALNCCVPGKPTNWFCFLDAATYVSTNDLDLSKVKPDFVCISFYKIFGYPTGLGALLVKNSVGHVLKKEYFGGGSVLISLSNQKFHINKRGFERFEDGTISFLSILSLQHGFDTISKLVGNMANVTIHTFNLARYFYSTLISMHHSNGKPVAKVYCDTDYDNMDTQGNIVNFNLLRANGSYIGYAEVLQMANLNKIHLRTGCFCNPGACQRHLNLSDQELLENYEAGHVCGDTIDLINGKPTGSVRISFGYMSTKTDADSLLTMIQECFIENHGVSLKCFNEETNKFSEATIYDEEKDHSLAKPSTIDSKSELLHKFSSVYVEQHGIVNDLSNTHLSHIFLYPVKSCGAFQVKSWHIGPSGLLYDRQWMIMTANGVCVTQKMVPTLCMIQPTIDLKTEELVLNFPGMQQISVPLNAGKKASTLNLTICHSKVCGKKVQVVDCGEEVSEWITAAIQDSSHGKLRLYSQYCATGDFTKTTHASNSLGQLKTLSLSNQAQFLLINYASVQWLLENTDREATDSPHNEEDMISRFRCNFVITGAERMSESNWNSLKIGGITFQSHGPCTRCQIICIDQKTGRKTKEPLTTIARIFEGKMKFGIYLSCENSLQTSAIISVGDSVSYTKNF
ncbi:molybdenum cofactor sulfurase 3 isoform X2 [Hetaerina americana]|uniref:molybdenum cofactor sulfurase 3 isoform X2 n=1 Tax=Hetaerina americana TaxID=62018 RepID=UPI003A7F5E9E